ncbi:MAG: tRNA pseudouridine(55) synthase TruB, partial [Paracoccus sp. (in: a-proteobacteria)]|nr:tRNA pseudouridine(55) synthase TruB [Paracoccus sp. (in: a-proteobacteria)]
MARKKGREISGWLIVDKPAGIGSTDVVGRTRWALDARKAGHAGTLDPDATGVLAIALGEATKTVPWLTEALKAYDFTVNWGAETTSDDAAGQITRQSPTRPTPDQIAAALPALTGEIMQVPPAVSAVKVDGARAYDLAREGETPDLAARPLWVESLRLLDTTPDTARLEMVCGKGGYVRAIARDLGRALG